MISLATLPADHPWLAHCLAIRRTVFIEEQGVAEEEEVDGLDPDCLHLLATRDGEPVGAARLRPYGPGVVKAERVAVLREARGEGIGAALMQGLHLLARRQGAEEVVLAAQLTALPFYERLAYVAEGPVFLDAGIEHRRMRLCLSGQ